MSLRIRTPALLPPQTSTVVWIKISGVWKKATLFLKIGGVWKQATSYIKVMGVWK